MAQACTNPADVAIKKEGIIHHRASAWRLGFVLLIAAMNSALLLGM